MRAPFRLAAAAILLVGVIISPPSWANDQPTAAAADASPPAPAATAADRETARNLMDRGDKQFKEGKYQEALKSYQAADKIVAVTSTGYGVGKSLEKLGRLIEARDKLLDVMHIPKAADEPPMLAEARADAEKLQREIATRIPIVTFNVRGASNLAEVTIQLGDRTITSDALTLPQRVDPGQLLVRASCPGDNDVTLTVLLDEGEERTIEINFADDADGPPPSSPTQTSTSSLVYVGFGTAGAGLLVGAITGGVSLRLAGEIDDGCSGPAGEQHCQAADADSAGTALALAHVSTISFALAGAGVTLGVIGLFLGGEEDAPKNGDPALASAAPAAITIQPVFGLGSVGLRGTF